MFAFLIRGLLGAALYGLFNLWYPSATQTVSQSTGGNFGNILLAIAVGCFLAILGTRDKSAENSKSILGKGVTLLKNACVACSAGIWKIVIEGKKKAEATEVSK